MRLLLAYIALTTVFSLALAGCGDTLPPTPTVVVPTPGPTADPRTTPISLKAIDILGFSSDRYLYNVVYDIVNNTRQDIVTFRGNVFFDDRAGQRVTAYQYVHENEMAAGQRVTYPHTFPVPTDGPSFGRLLRTPPEEITVRFEIQEITFKGGTIRQFP